MVFFLSFSVAIQTEMHWKIRHELSKNCKLVPSFFGTCDFWGSGSVVVCTFLLSRRKWIRRTGGSTKKKVDFGKFRGKAHSKFEIRNRSLRKAKIRKIVSGCGCANIGKYMDLIPPDVTMEVPVSLSAKGRTGKLSEAIIVYWQIENEAPHRTEVFLTGEVVN